MRPTIASLNSIHLSMVQNVLGQQNYIFSWLCQPCLNYETQKTIDPECVKVMAAYSNHYGGNVGLIVRFLLDETSRAWRDPPFTILKVV